MPERRPAIGGVRGETGPTLAFEGLTLLVPGLPQWRWRQRERGLVLLTSFATAMAVGLFAWGTRTGLALLAFAYLTHVVSAADAIRQWAFPGFGRWVPTFSASAGLGLGCYGPLVLIGSLVAWPGVQGGASPDGYLVNRWAYRSSMPEPGDRVWLGDGRGGAGNHLAEILARPGEEVDWSDQGLRAGGRRLDLVPFRPGETPRGLSFKVPQGQLLVSFRSDDPFLPKSWELVPKSEVEGRAWAKLYPVWGRQMLH